MKSVMRERRRESNPPERRRASASCWGVEIVASMKEGVAEVEAISGRGARAEVCGKPGRFLVALAVVRCCSDSWRGRGGRVLLGKEEPFLRLTGWSPPTTSCKAQQEPGCS